MKMFQEDDERDLSALREEKARNDKSMDMMQRELGYGHRQSERVHKAIEARQIDPVIKALVDTAKSEGHSVGENEALKNRIKHLETRIEVRDKHIAGLEAELDRTADRDEWVERAKAAEEAHKKLKNSRRRR